MNPELFLADLEQKPQALVGLGERIAAEDPWAAVDPSLPLVLLGMGSSHYANRITAARLRARGIDATASLASSDLLPQATADSTVIAVSASGTSAETLAAVEHYRGRAPIIAVTNTDGSALTDLADRTVLMHAGPEAGGVACRTYQHTLALGLALEERLLGDLTGGTGLAGVLADSAAATTDLLDRRGEWLGPFIDLAVGPDGTSFVAPDRRLASAQQSALMLREGPRRMAIACETGDWSHVDVYLTKTTDYRLVLFSGGRWEPALEGWVRERGSTLVSIGGPADGARLEIRYRHDDRDDVRLLTEVLVAELAAAALWTTSA